MLQTGPTYSLVLLETKRFNGNHNITAESHLAEKKNDPRRGPQLVVQRNIHQGLEIMVYLLISPPRVLFPKLFPGNREKILYL